MKPELLSLLLAAAPLQFITEPAAVKALESQGLDLGTRIHERPASSNEALAKEPAFRMVVKVLERDLADVRRADRGSGVGMRYAHRLFDTRWLSSPRARFQLVGVFNRFDRQDFHPGSCGETRLLYRLTDDSPDGKSRLPMTINLVSWQPVGEGGDCAEALKAWTPPGELQGDALARWATSDRGPLRAASLAKLKSLEVNLQSVRWPSTVRPDLGGHAEYVLRVFHREGAQLRPAPLENSPDVERLKKDSGLRKELLAWLSTPEALAKVDDGTVVLPEKFLATRATSVAPHGMARLANRPFRQLFEPKDFAQVSLPGAQVITTPAALLRRLDGLSCEGCHQSRSIAGFHFLGEDPPGQNADAIALAMSPHLHGEVHRRSYYLAAVAGGQRPSLRRPLPERDSEGGYGARCGAPASGLEAQGCAQGLRCVVLEDAEMGACLPAEPEVGDPCQAGRISASANAQVDRVSKLSARACREGDICEVNSVGFPLGMCATGCDSTHPSVACGEIALLQPFNDCLGARKPLAECLTHVRPAGLRKCDRHNPCRDDYVCARTSSGGGACLPPYFLFQLRVDGHR